MMLNRWSYGGRIKGQVGQLGADWGGFLFEGEKLTICSQDFKPTKKGGESLPVDPIILTIHSKNTVTKSK